MNAAHRGYLLLPPCRCLMGITKRRHLVSSKTAAFSILATRSQPSRRRFFFTVWPWWIYPSIYQTVERGVKGRLATKNYSTKYSIMPIARRKTRPLGLVGEREQRDGINRRAAVYQILLYFVSAPSDITTIPLAGAANLMLPLPTVYCVFRVVIVFVAAL